VAAVNVAGETIHSVVRFRPDVTPDRVRRVSAEQRRLYRQLDTVIIDEISMVRADLLDCVARFLELNGPRPGAPFGGVQLVFFGDLYQLPPVVQPGEEELFRTFYDSPYFFSARCLAGLDLEWVELTRRFRQHDGAFLAVLDAIRTGTATEEHLALLNRRVLADPDPAALEGYVFLTPTNALASRINREQLERLPGRAHVFRAEVRGEFDPRADPTERELTLKRGARVMLLSNDPYGRWVNGTLATVRRLRPQEGRITVALEDGREEELEPFTWDLFRFRLEGNRLRAVSVGQFVQLPVRPAWALTIHKSQGLTLERAVVDLTHPTFAHGQLYVALSRLRSLERLVLTRPVKRGHIRLDPRVREFVTAYRYRLAGARLPPEERRALLE
jgi:ATP-dependent exoDNAse (exonuclease V) alpha subunit